MIYKNGFPIDVPCYRHPNHVRPDGYYFNTEVWFSVVQTEAQHILRPGVLERGGSLRAESILRVTIYNSKSSTSFKKQLRPVLSNFLLVDYTLSA